MDGVERFAVLDSLGGFQDHRDRPETGIIDQKAKRLQTEVAPADSGVAIDSAPLFPATVVEVPDSNPAKANDPVELPHQSIVLFLGSQRIASRENMTGVHANTEPLGLGDQ